MTSTKDNLLARYQALINQVLPERIHQPIRFNHCFARVVLDYLFDGVWYEHIDRRPAYQALSSEQLQRAIQRMEGWLENQDLLVEDNQRSLQWRKKRSGNG